MQQYEKRKTNTKQEDAMLVGSDSWMKVRFAQEAAKSWKRIAILAVVAILCLFAPALGLIIGWVQSLLGY